MSYTYGFECYNEINYLILRQLAATCPYVVEIYGDKNYAVVVFNRKDVGFKFFMRVYKAWED